MNFQTGSEKKIISSNPVYEGTKRNYHCSVSIQSRLIRDDDVVDDGGGGGGGRIFISI